MRRVFAISDLHIGGDEHPMLGHPERLIDFLDQLAACSLAGGVECELVVHGDLVDFLAEEPAEAFCDSENRAMEKFGAILQRWRALFDAFARCITKLTRFTVLLGNHDVELAYPRVREIFFRALGTTPHRCLFIHNNEGYRVGELLIEHGNRYDTWNAIDHDGLRQALSCASRGETPPRRIEVCPGSRFVHEVMNPLKARYHFVDLLKPEDKLVALLLTTFEPELKRDLPSIFQLAASYAAQSFRRLAWAVGDRGHAPGQERMVSRSEEPLPAEVRSAFKAELATGDADQLVGTRTKVLRFFGANDSQSTDSMKRQLEGGDAPDPTRLRKLQVALAHKLRDDVSFVESDSSDSYALAARELSNGSDVKVVVMGHTHLRRDIDFGDGRRYVNTGTWADLIRAPPLALEDSEDGRALLVEWLTRLVTDRVHDIRVCDASYADLLVNDDGRVVQEGRPLLYRHVPGARLP